MKSSTYIHCWSDRPSVLSAIPSTGPAEGTHASLALSNKTKTNHHIYRKRVERSYDTNILCETKCPDRKPVQGGKDRCHVIIFSQLIKRAPAFGTTCRRRRQGWSRPTIRELQLSRIDVIKAWRILSRSLAETEVASSQSWAEAHLTTEPICLSN